MILSAPVEGDLTTSPRLVLRMPSLCLELLVFKRECLLKQSVLSPHCMLRRGEDRERLIFVHRYVDEEELHSHLDLIR